MNIAILFLIFKRPKLTQNVFQEIIKIKPKILFIAADGSKEGEEEICKKTR